MRVIKVLIGNDYSDTEKDKVSQAHAHKSLTNNPHAVTFAQLGSKPTTLSGFGITDAYTKAYIDSLKDLNGWESELITSTPLTNSGTIALTMFYKVLIALSYLQEIHQLVKLILIVLILH